MPVAATGVPCAIECVSSGDNSRPHVLPIRITNPLPAVMRSFTAQVAGNGFAAEKVDHPALGVLTGSCTKFRRIDPVQSNRCAVNNDGVGVSDMKGAGCGSGGK